MKSVARVIQVLQQAGYQAYIVGGAVRDQLLGQRVNDYDLATDAAPREIERLFAHTRSVGRQFGVILVKHRRKWFEIATFRQDVGTDGRRPQRIKPATAQEDAQRRDFTINALFYDPVQDRLIDYVGGRKDLSRKIIRFIGDPQKRIQEDYLRLLRAIRFKNLIGGTYATATWSALRKNSDLVKNVSTERIIQELNKMWTDQHRFASLVDLRESGLLKVIIPELDLAWQQKNNLATKYQEFARLPKQVAGTLVWALLFYDLPSPLVVWKKFARQYRFSTAETEAVGWLLHRVDYSRSWPWSSLLTWDLFRAANFSQLLSFWKIIDNTNYHKILKQYQRDKDKYLKFKPLVTGDDLFKWGITAGREMGKYLKEIQIAQLEGRINTKSEAKAFLARRK